MSRLIPPLGGLLLTAAIMAWTYPSGVPLWRAIAITSAWGAAVLLAVSLLLMIREPRFAHWMGGLENAYRWHHISGLLAYMLALLHPLALALDALRQEPSQAWLILVPWEQTWPIWLGWISLLSLMFGMATTFAVRLPYRLWRRCHLALGMGVALGYAHIYFIRGESALLFAAMAVVVAAMAWRLLASDLGAASHPYQVTRVVRPAAAAMVEATLMPLAARMKVAAGQFVVAAFADGDRFRGCREHHPFTVSGIGKNGDLRVTIKALGPCSRHLQELEAGVVVRLQGPYGSFLADTDSTPQLWIAGGIGVTPFMAALRDHRRRQPTTLVYWYRSESDAAFVDELQSLARQDPHLTLHAMATGNEPPDFRSLADSLGEIGDCEVQICGPAPLVRAILPELRRKGVADNRIHFENFDFR